MAYNYALLETMDTLWFHQAILFNPPVSFSGLTLNSVPAYISDSFTSTTTSYQSSSFTSSTNPAGEEDYVLSDDSPLTLQISIDSESEERKKIFEEMFKETRPSRLDRIKSSSRKASRSKKRYCGSVMRLQKTMSCKSSEELEVEEVKGFMDLGFKFDTENLSPRMMSVVPGLQRLGGSFNTDFLQKEMIDEVIENNESDESRSGGVTRRPYLSEAWLISRPDSTLLNLRIPRNSKTADMKKHLKFWAVTVASVVHQES